MFCILTCSRVSVSCSRVKMFVFKHVHVFMSRVYTVHLRTCLFGHVFPWSASGIKKLAFLHAQVFTSLGAKPCHVPICQRNHVHTWLMFRWGLTCYKKNKREESQLYLGELPSIKRRILYFKINNNKVFVLANQTLLPRLLRFFANNYFDP